MAGETQSMAGEARRPRGAGRRARLVRDRRCLLAVAFVTLAVLISVVVAGVAQNRLRKKKRRRRSIRPYFYISDSAMRPSAVKHSGGEG
ncbi:hypothetical protein EVAR_59839_1 [Eumeta japonica]|uniref:Uncharacterized protein n=1 Tax=Eumeta variegata TaxID=151549 RepID=A0A4C1Z2G1_EUMVA|nr:hypothetical protein EVAR_59839_1 [Eumeta japonica]